MNDDTKSEPNQTTPTGYEIPIPTKEDFENVLDAVSKPAKPLPKGGPKKKGLE